MLGLGRNYDLIPLVGVVDFAGATPGSKQFSLRDAGSVDIHIATGDGVAGDDVDFTITKHVDLADTTGVPIAMGSLGAASALDYYWVKSHATLLSSAATWSKVAYGDADGVFAPLDDASGEACQHVVIHISAGELGDGYTSLKLTIADVGAGGAKLGYAFAILNDLAVQRSPENLRSAIS